MPIDAIVRVSFQSEPRANQAANLALVGDRQESVGPGPFRRVNTAVYSCSGAPDIAVGRALADFGSALNEFSAEVDFASVTLIRRP